MIAVALVVVASIVALAVTGLFVYAIHDQHPTALGLAVPMVVTWVLLMAALRNLLA